MSDSRETILRKLRAVQRSDVHPPLEEHLPMVPSAPEEDLVGRFVAEAERIGCTVYQPESDAAAREIIADIVGADPTVQVWEFAHIPLAGLADMLEVAEPRDASVRVGITGADAALAATGSLVLTSGPGKHRLTSLLPPVHVAVVRRSHLFPDFESWVAAQRKRGIDAFRRAANAMIISGQSRTADIAMQLVMGMHGPGELHILLVE